VTAESVETGTLSAVIDRRYSLKIRREAEDGSILTAGNPQLPISNLEHP
jgi:hypothetical protein